MNTNLFLRTIPVQLKNDFKIACLRRGETMTDAVIKFMKKRVKEDRGDDRRQRAG